MIANAPVASPKDLSAALALLSNGSDWTITAGGTDLMVQGQQGSIAPQHVLNIWSLDELRTIQEEGDWIVIGALASYTQIIQSPLVQAHLPALVESARSVGAVQIQNRGTLGGNLGNASPAADTPPALWAADGQVVLLSQAGQRIVSLDDFFLGYRSIDRRPDEIIASVRCRKKRVDEFDWYRKVGPRRAQAISKVVLGGRARVNKNGVIEGVCLAAGSLAATTIRLTATEAALRGEALSEALADRVGAVAAQEVNPIDDIRSTAIYRSRVTGNLVRRWVLDLCIETAR